LPGEDADFDFSLVEPASVSWRVVDGEAVPNLFANFISVEIRRRLDAMDVQVIHHEVDGVGFRVLGGHAEGHLREFESGAIRSGESEVTPRFEFYRAENIGRAVTLVFVIAPRFASWCGSSSGADVDVQADGLLIHTNHGLFRIIGPFIVASTSSIRAM
jgi:hypothetical protein